MDKNGKVKGDEMLEIITSKKVLAAKVGRNPRFVRDMIRGGFRMPCTLAEAKDFLTEHPHPTRNREQRGSRCR